MFVQTVPEESILLCRYRSLYFQITCTHTLCLTALSKLLQTTQHYTQQTHSKRYDVRAYWSRIVSSGTVCRINIFTLSW